MNTALKEFYTKEDLLHIYRQLVTPRLIEERMLKLLRQNKIAKWFSGIGQEAISIGVTLALHNEDYILPMHRNLGVFTSRNVDLYRLFCQLFGKNDGFTKGRERSFHFGLMEHHIIGMISHLGAMLPVAAGLSLAAQLRGENRIAVAFTGDGATSEGDFHEALNLAAVWKLPVLFVVENNGYGLSTPTQEQYACKDIADKGIGYGIESFIVDGNDVLAVFEKISELRASILEKPRPILVEMKTFRMRGHEEASGIAYVPQALLDEWGKKDPIKRFEEKLRNEFGFEQSIFESEREAIFHQIDKDIERALQSPLPTPNSINLQTDILKPYAPVEEHTSGKMVERRFVDAISEGLAKAFSEDESVIMMGQDIAEYGGVFKVSQNFVQRFGKHRVRNTPIIESGAIGAAYGLALAGMKPIVEMQFADFITCGFNQIVNNIAKSLYRWSDGINVTIRAPHGAGVGAGPFHSQSPEAWFMQHPGLKVLVPTSVQDAQDMVYTAIQDPNPVLIFEHKKLYRSLKELVTESPKLIDYHKANWIRKGTDVTIITYGMGVHWAKEIIEKENLIGQIGVLDLRCLSPIDTQSIVNAVKETGKVLLLEEHGGLLGPMSEVARIIAEQAFEYLDAPVFTCSSLPTPVPTNTQLEQDFLASARLRDTLKRVMIY